MSRARRVQLTALSAAMILSTLAVPPAQAAAARPVIVIDAGHSLTVHARDRTTGLDVSDYANEPEMRDVWWVAERVRARLIHDGYRVVMTKTSLYKKTSLGARAHTANRVHAALALSIHDQAGRAGGIGFRKGNNTVYYQSVGTYRSTPSGHRVYFRNKKVAALSKKYAKVFARYRHITQKATVRTRGNVGYNLGSRGLAAGNIWMVQLLAEVPWIYNEAGGNSVGRGSLSQADRHTYADALVAAVEHCVPRPR
jgi:N-acetylmuramoyl-L-alanine amidase